jgi:hypothetical protein
MQANTAARTSLLMRQFWLPPRCIRIPCPWRCLFRVPHRFDPTLHSARTMSHSTVSEISTATAAAAAQMRVCTTVANHFYPSAYRASSMSHATTTSMANTPTATHGCQPDAIQMAEPNAAPAQSTHFHLPRLTAPIPPVGGA